MDPYFRNPLPLEDAEGVNIEDRPFDLNPFFDPIDEIVQSMSQQYTDDWDKTVEYAIKQRRGFLKHPHISVYDREGSLQSRDEIFYRFIDCKIDTISLAQDDCMMVLNSDLRKVENGYKSHVTMRNLRKLEEIVGLNKCYVTIANCDLDKLIIHGCDDCKFEIIKDNFGGDGSNTSYMDGFIKNNRNNCSFRLNGITMEGEIEDGSDAIIHDNDHCYFWLTNCLSRTVKYSFRKNTNSNSIFKTSEFRNNDWIFFEEQAHNLISEYTKYNVIVDKPAEHLHGFNGTDCNLSYRKDLLYLAKCWTLLTSYVGAVECEVGSDYNVLSEQSRFFFQKCTLIAGVNNTKCTECHFHINECKVIAGETNHKDIESDYNTVDCIYEAGENNFDCERSRYKGTSNNFVAGQYNFKGTECCSTNNMTKMKASPANFTGDPWLLAQFEECVLTATDGFKPGNYEKFKMRRTIVDAQSHPINGSNLKVAEITESKLIRHAIVTGDQWLFKDTQWLGPVDFYNIEQIHEINMLYGDTLSLNNVRTVGDAIKVNGAYSAINRSNIRYKRSNFMSTASHDNAYCCAETSTYSSTLSHSSCNLVQMKGCSVNGNHSISQSQADLKGNSHAAPISISNSNANILGTSAPLVSMSSSNVRTFGGSLGIINLDASTTGTICGTSAILNTVAKSGIIVGAGVTVEVTGGDHKESVGGHFHRWVNGHFWERVGQDSLHLILGNTNWATLGSAIFQSAGPVDVTSPPRTPAHWVPGSFSPIPEPPN